ncbi:MAG: hypothetical protein WC600_17445 [Desulfobaccales bacterium]
MKRRTLALLTLLATTAVLCNIAYGQQDTGNPQTVFRGTIANITDERTMAIGPFGVSQSIIVLTLKDYPKKKFIINDDMALNMKIIKLDKNLSYGYADEKRLHGKKAQIYCELKQTLSHNDAIMMEYYDVSKLDLIDK